MMTKHNGWFCITTVGGVALCALALTSSSHFNQAEAQEAAQTVPHAAQEPMRSIETVVASAPSQQAAAQADRISVLVHMSTAPSRADRSAQRANVRQYTADQNGAVRYEYDILPNVLNLRDLPATAVHALRNMPGVIKVEEDRIIHTTLNNSIPLINGLQSQIGDAGLSADGSGVRICVVDTGILHDHIMFAPGQIDTAAGWDFSNNDSNPEDDNFHGTHVAGIAVGSLGLAVPFCDPVGGDPFHGVAPLATVIAVKVFDANGNGTLSDAIAGIQHCVDPALPNGPADVINLSFGGGTFVATCDEDSLAMAANAAVDAGAVVVAGAGNDRFTNALIAPACGSKVIAVGATYDETFDGITNCASPGESVIEHPNCTDTAPALDSLVCFSNKSVNLDVTAPGCEIYSAVVDGALTSRVASICGTSQAAPHVSGLAALILDTNLNLTPDQVRQIIRNGAIDLGAAGFDTSFGHGRIDVINSLNLALGDCNNDDDADGVLNCSDVCPSSPAPGGSDATGRPLGDVDANCTVDLQDQAITTQNFSGP